MQKGKTEPLFYRGSFIISTANIVGKKEGEGPLAGHFDVIGEDDKFGQNTWEEAESTLQKEAFTMAVGRAGLKKEDIRYLFAGDLLGADHGDLVWGAGFSGTALWTLRSLQYRGGIAVSRCDVCSGRLCGSRRDHDFKSFASAEKQFRFPLEYANQRPKSATWTVTGSAAFVLGKREGNGKNHGDHNWKNCGFWDQRFHEHGGSHGTSSQRGHQTAF